MKKRHTHHSFLGWFACYCHLIPPSPLLTLKWISGFLSAFLSVWDPWTTWHIHITMYSKTMRWKHINNLINLWLITVKGFIIVNKYVLKNFCIMSVFYFFYRFWNLLNAQLWKGSPWQYFMPYSQQLQEPPRNSCRHWLQWMLQQFHIQHSSTIKDGTFNQACKFSADQLISFVFFSAVQLEIEKQCTNCCFLWHFPCCCDKLWLHAKRLHNNFL